MRGVTRPQRRRLLVPEAVQTSAMDCGPAALKCLLDGFGVPVSYGRLREACQTSVDGTSIDTLEDVAVRLGLDAEQIIVPVDRTAAGGAGAASLVVVHGGVTSWWRGCHSRHVRSWTRPPGAANLPTVPYHPRPLCRFRPPPGAPGPAPDECRDVLHWLASWTLRGSARRLDTALQGAGEWLATLDAALRMVTALVHAGGLRRSRQARALEGVWRPPSDA